MSFQRTKKIKRKSRQRGRKNNNYHTKYNHSTTAPTKIYMKYWK